MKRVTERLKQQMRASWRLVLRSMLRLAYRAQDRLEQKLINPHYERTPTQ
jgi:hypothetical protein